MDEQRKKELLVLKERLDSIEDDTQRHDYKMDSDFLGFGSIFQIILLNNLVHKELGIAYESAYRYETDFPDDLRNF